MDSDELDMDMSCSDDSSEEREEVKNMVNKVLYIF